MDKIMAVIVVVSLIFIGVITMAIIERNEQTNACQAKGGHIVKTHAGHVCAKLSII